MRKKVYRNRIYKKGQIMLITLLKSKIHSAKITKSDLNYQGSIGIDEDLMDASGIVEYEKVLVANISNGNRFETYVITGERGTGVIGLNGAASRLGELGDKIIIFAFAQVEEDKLKDHKPKIVLVDENNAVSEIIY